MRRSSSNFILLSIFLILIIGILMSCMSCGKKEKFGEAISEQKSTEIGDIFTHPKDYEGKTVKVEGKIVEECPSGCWFNLKDETGVIYIDIMPSGFAIPQKVGRQATVEGKVITKEGKLMIIGKGVEIK